MLTFFHTAPANVALFSGLMAELAPDIPTRHAVHAEPLERAIAAGGVTPGIRSDLEALVLEALGNDTAVLVCTCSTIGEVVDELEARVPLLRVDRPMAVRAAEAGPRVLVAACLESTAGPTGKLVSGEVQRRHGEHGAVQVVRIFDAWAHWQAGDKPAYWARIAERLRESAAGFDAIVLAQASMAGAAELLADLGVPVLASPRVGTEAAIALYRRQVF
jgi:hypothetical protein